MSETIQKGFNTVDRAFVENGQLTTEDIPQEILYYWVTGLRLKPDAEFLGDGVFPLPIPEFLEALEVRGNTLRYSDNVFIRLPDTFEDVGNIPEIEYSDDPFLQVGPLSTRRYERMKEEVGKIYGDYMGKDRTTGIPVDLEMNIPEKVKQDPLGADFTGQMVEK